MGETRPQIARWNFSVEIDEGLVDYLIDCDTDPHQPFVIHFHVKIFCNLLQRQFENEIVIFQRDQSRDERGSPCQVLIDSNHSVNASQKSIQVKG